MTPTPEELQRLKARLLAEPDPLSCSVTNHGALALIELVLLRGEQILTIASRLEKAEGERSNVERELRDTTVHRDALRIERDRAKHVADELRARNIVLSKALPDEKVRGACQIVRGLTLPTFAMLPHERAAFDVFKAWLQALSEARAPSKAPCSSCKGAGRGVFPHGEPWTCSTCKGLGSTIGGDS